MTGPHNLFGRSENMTEEHLDFAQALEAVAAAEAVIVSLDEFVERAPDSEIARLLYGE